MPNAYNQKAILTAVETVVAAIDAFAMATPAVVVARRKRPFFSKDHGDVLPFVCVCPLKEVDMGWDTEKLVRWGYPVVVAILQQQGATLASATELDWQLDRRANVRDALIADGALGLSQVECFGYDPEPIFDLGGLDRILDVSLQMFTFTTDETR